MLALTEGGTTGLVATLDGGPGPVVGVRVDVDALPVRESDQAGDVSVLNTGLDQDHGHTDATGGTSRPPAELPGDEGSSVRAFAFR